MLKEMGRRLYGSFRRRVRKRVPVVIRARAKDGAKFPQEHLSLAFWAEGQRVGTR